MLSFTVCVSQCMAVCHKLMRCGFINEWRCAGVESSFMVRLPAQVPDWSRDNAAGRAALQMAGLEVFESALHLEGGSIHVDGEGCAACRSCSCPRADCLVWIQSWTPGRLQGCCAAGPAERAPTSAPACCNVRAVHARGRHRPLNDRR